MYYAHLPKSVTGRTMVSAWSLLGLIMIGTYCGNLIAFLTVTRSTKPFDSIKEMVQHGGYTWGTIGGSLWEDSFLVNLTWASMFNNVCLKVQSCSSPSFYIHRLNDMYSCEMRKQNASVLLQLK